MKNILNAIKIHLKLISPLYTGIGFSMIAATLIFTLITPSKREPVNLFYYSTLMTNAHLGIFMCIQPSFARIHTSKFFSSVSCARELYITAPVIIMFTLCMINDIPTALLALLKNGNSGLSSMLISNAFMSSLIIISAICFAKKGIFMAVFIFFYMGIFISPMLSITNRARELFISTESSLLIAAGFYLAALIITLIILKLWWKKGNRILTIDKTSSNSAIASMFLKSE